ncbi:CoA pyrophosphatase [Flammeovirgaceae bacterium SG7u.111]|nr:CoA pyrophosphatase [Flammeovirgaceae bacterium SG7u.132]WPO37691.1 CoA pyrophosphatase [Flammeovirgaceae bacterium SG7u.111]
MEELKSHLLERFTLDLPGPEAHAQMASESRKKRLNNEPSANPRRSAVLALIYRKTNELFLPLIRRQTYKGVHSGQMAFPGGRVEEQDKSLKETALRETSEEIGVQIPKNKIVGQLTEIYIPPSNSLVTPYVALSESSFTFQPDPREVAEVVEVGLKELLNPFNYSVEKIKVHDNVIINAPSYKIRGNIIWGATAMMLSELLMVLGELESTKKFL